MSSQDDSNTFFRVPCEFQLRYRELSEEEARVFEEATMRPSPYSAIRGEVDTLLEGLKFGDSNRGLIERAFQILINIDQRLERIEEDFQNFVSGRQKEVQNFSWYHGNLGAGGIQISKTELPDFEVGSPNLYLMDLLLPSMPEQRIVCSAKAEDAKDTILFHFQSIHEDDREFIHRFVAARERELLRTRASHKKDD